MPQLKYQMVTAHGATVKEETNNAISLDKFGPRSSERDARRN